MNLEDEEWFELEEGLLREPGTIPRKFKICADANVPKRMVDEIRQSGIPVKTTFEDQVSTKADTSVLAWVKQSDRVLLTLDRDFWDDRKFPLQKSPGVLFIDIPPDRVDEALEAFWLVFKTFACFLGNWEEMKIRASRNGYILKGISWDGNNVHYETKVVNGRALVREVLINQGST